MSVRGAVRRNWRITLLIVLLTVSLFALFGPNVGAGQAEVNVATGEVTTNLVYGIQLDGGARIRGQPEGMTATGIELGDRSEQDVSGAVADELGLDQIDVTASNGTRAADGSPTVEVFSGNVTEEEFAAALDAAGVPYEDIEDGVTRTTLEETARVAESKIRESALSGGSAWTSTSFGGESYVVVEAPNRDAGELEQLITERGVVEVRAYYPENGSYTNETVLRQGDFADIGPGGFDQTDSPGVTVQVRDDVARNLSERMVELGFTPQAQCPLDFREASGGERCLLVVSDGEVVSSFGVRESLGTSFENGDFVNRPTFTFETTSIEEARELSVELRAGALPAPLNVVDTLSVQPALAERFKFNSLLTGLIAALAVSGVVYIRYDDPRIAVPMVATALSEIVLLLGFAAAVSYPLNLSVIAGFIAVIGTGVDDLVIIADEVLSEGDVKSGRVFRSRFRRAFWVIGAAAATTIIAMSPLAVLQLGDLQGFAIVTILGVLLGVLVTRPAYGDVLRRILTDS